MKRTISLIAIFAMLLMSAVSANAIDLQAGVKTDVTIKKELEMDKTGIDVDYSRQDYDVFVDVAVGDSIVITPKAGLTTFKMEADDISIGGSSIEADLDGGIGFNLGLDAEFTVVRSEYADLTLLGGYTFSRADVDSVNVQSLKIDNPIETIVTTHEFELGAKVSKDLSTVEALQDFIKVPFTPYVGVVYTDLRGNIDVNLSVVDLNEDIRAKDNVGLRMGFDVEPVDNLKIGVGFSFVDETAVEASVSYLF